MIHQLAPTIHSDWRATLGYPLESQIYRTMLQANVGHGVADSILLSDHPLIQSQIWKLPKSTRKLVGYSYHRMKYAYWHIKPRRTLTA